MREEAENLRDRMPPAPVPLWDSPELLYIKFTSKDQTLILASVLTVKSDFTMILQGFRQENTPSPVALQS